jgi:tetratricopeptide (TPR) repeat protein
VTSSPSFLLQEAILMHQRGALADAAARYSEVLRSEPKNVDALCLLGMALIQQGQAADAAKRLRKAIRLFPDHAPAHSALGVALRDLGQIDEALVSFNRAITKQPGYLDAHVNRAGLLMSLGRAAEAVEAYDKALALRPDHLPALIDRGIALDALGRVADALSSFERALAVQPNAFEAHANRANALARLGRHEEAVAAFDRALAIHDRLAELHVNRGNSLRELDRLPEALASYDAALSRVPDMGAAHFSRGITLKALDRYDEALAAFDRALKLDLFGNDPVARAHLQWNRAAVLDLLGRPDEAFAEAEHCLQLAPQDDEIRYLVSLMQLLHGRWREAWPNYERRVALKIGIPPDFTPPPFPLWRGEEPDGGLLLIRCEHGRGDRIQFACFAADLARRGHRVVLWTDLNLAPLLRTVPGVELVVESLDALPAGVPGRWAHMMSVPAVLQTTPDTVPQTVPYLAADPTLAAKWRERLGTHGFKIGIAWQGSPTQRQDRRRSIPLAVFAPLAEIPDARLISPQKGFGSEQIAQVGFWDSIETLEELDTGAAAFLDTAAVMMSLDLVVSIDSAIVHLAGALGRPTFVPLGPVGDWRWLLQREDSPFYPSLRIFRQMEVGEWTDVMARIAEAARACAAGRERSDDA